MAIRKNLPALALTLLLVGLLAGCGGAAKTSFRSSKTQRSDVSVAPLTTRSGELVNQYNFDPEEFGYTKYDSVKEAEDAAGYQASLPDKKAGAQVRSVFVGTSRIGTKELGCHFDGYSLAKWPSEAVDYASTVEMIKKENEERAKALAEDPSMKELQGDAPIPQAAQLPYVITLEGKTVGVWPDLAGSIYLFEWWESGFTYQLGAFANELSNEEKLETLKSF